MNAPQAEALTLCKRIIDNGSRNSDVFWKLSSAQFQEGQKEHANRTLSDALRLYPNNAKLLALKNIISSATTEQERIASSANKNQRYLDRGALKILCLTKSGFEAISACKRRLELTNDDGDRMRAKLAELENEQKTSVEVIAPESVTLPEPQVATTDEPSVAPIAGSSTVTPIATQAPISDTQIDSITQIDPDQLAAEARTRKYRILVAEVQRNLTELGFPAGLPDGIPGNQTRRALTDFYTKLNIKESTSISDLTLEELQQEQRKLLSAMQLLRQSTEALNNGNRTLAQQRLVEAKANSLLLKVPTDLEQAVTSQQIATAPLPADSTARVSPKNKLATNPTPTTQATSNLPTAVTNNASSESEQFDELMKQIKILYGKIKRIETDQASRIDQARNSL